MKTPIDSLVEVHEVIVTVEDIPDKPSPRHEQEKKNLMKRLSKSHGKWNTNHPRHRLMEALFGFSRYKARQMAELNRWKDLYTHVSKAQKKVGALPTPPACPIVTDRSTCIGAGKDDWLL